MNLRKCFDDNVGMKPLSKSYIELFDDYVEYYENLLP